MRLTRLTPFGFTVALGLGLVAPVAGAAQESDAAPAVATVDASDLPVSFDRIKRRMAATRPTQDGRRPLLNLSFYVDVYARAPAIEFLQNFDLNSEAVSYGAPTHTEMLEVATPREWRPRAISTGNLFGWR